ncbi:uncharacterized protein TRAVEDRAFT_24243 [Trametes versicolor FP-101664 SS1]|uniref:uncharacterized protein n=1 Tax=Trametes versicolor (strain FP-101664) TaxID=717944 RepID=UPI0004622ADB|nr:uncharacterized protein TRAVEDRAFT_24243 [Trametes versicolor FP-101664 SS1]EIW52854.1 hypothetical protein TRAVEDRAFT_24243 [Trametes versicolor FP-101664 SS1]
MTSTVATSRQAERRSLRSPPPKPKTRVARPPVPVIPLHFLKPVPAPQAWSSTVVKPEAAPVDGMFLPPGSCLVQPRPKTQPRPTRPAPSTEVAHRHAHLYDYKPIAGAQYQTLKCKLIFLHEARKRDSIVYHSVRDV